MSFPLLFLFCRGLPTMRRALRRVGASPSVDKTLAERARLLKREWEALQVTPTTYTARREHHKISEELTARMVELLATI
jgi:hypothetical protein